MILFSEKQKFRQWWIWLVLLAMAGFFAFAVYQQLVLKKPVGDNPASDTGLLIISLIPVFLILLFLFSELETEISESGVSYKFYPFHLRKITVSWGNLEKAFVRKYNPITEYGGWGFRLGIFGHGRALNISGNMGLQLVLKNGKRLLLGTKKPDEMEKVILQMREKKIFDDTASH
jgi:hypothetical protein